ncbi:DNA-protecting protein DprA [Candidatus Microgenomates bacterium]|nr:DNA-protecting protein DprA [Candidatus Microgenomates bacterium]
MGYKKIVDWKKFSELKRLLDLADPPKELYYQGKWDPEIFKNCTAVVGSRRISDYGRRAVEKIIPKLVFDNKTVVSGFMYGTDQYAHQVCLDSGGKTIAVLGWGINFPLAGYDKKLAERIASGGGLLISEWESQKPTLWTFPRRNRLVAALCQEAIVVEAAQQSGSLITARIATSLGRRLWAVPGPITSRTSAGTNNLIVAGLAKMWLGEETVTQLSFDDPVLMALDSEGLTADEIARKISLPVSEIGAKLTMFSLSGQILERGGKYFLNDAN